MILHSNARTCPQSRRLLVERVLEDGWSLAAAAEAAGISERTAWKWVDRYRGEGEAGLSDRSSAPKRVPSRTPADREELILQLRELRFTSPEIAQTLGQIHVPACTPPPVAGGPEPRPPIPPAPPSPETNHDVVFTLDEPPEPS